MERRFNTEDFEISLKAHADDFKMVPSKKVWHGIYNDLYPGTRWPSVAMSLVFIFTLVIIGHLNTNNSKILAALNSPAKIPAPGNLISKKKIKIHPVHSSNNGTEPFINDENNIIAGNSRGSITPQADQYTFPVFHQNNNLNSSGNNTISNENNKTNLNSNDPVNASDPSTIVKNDLVIINKSGILKEPVTNENSFKTDVENIIEIPLNKSIANATKSTYNKKENSPALNKNLSEAKQQIKNKAKENSEQQEEKTSGSSFLSKKIRDKISIVFHVSPSYSYRNVTEKRVTPNSGANTVSNSFISNSYVGLYNPVVNKPIIGLEAGAALNYNLSKRWQAIAGIQINYAGFNIQANNVHPVSTSLLLISDFTGEPYAFNSKSIYGNGSGSSHVTLHQYSFQASIPFGLKYMIAGNDNLQLNAEATFQPSYIFAKKAYLLSADKRNYVTEPSLLRTLNMSTNFGTNISFKSNNFNWQIGPQVFYQVLSTYSQNYPTREHLLNYGIKFGVSKLKK